MAGWLEDLWFAMRQLRRSPGFALTGVVTLALGIGAGCVMFSVVHSVLLEPLPYREADRLVGVQLGQPGEPAGDAQTGETAQFVMDHAKSFSSFGVANRGGAAQESLSFGHGQPMSVPALHVSAGYLPTLGVMPLLGRSFTPAEDTPGGARVAIVSERLWKGELGGDRGVIGRVIRLDGDPATVIGVLPAELATVDAPDVWEPMRMSPKDPGYGGTNYGFVARLRPGVSLAQARAEMGAMSSLVLEAFPGLKRWNRGGPPVGEWVWPLQEVVAAEAKPGIAVLSAAVGMVLLIACLNLAALMTARMAGRAAELALRSALGAGRGQLLRVALAESVLLALAGGVLGLAGAALALPMLLRAAPLELPRLQGVHIGGETALFAFAAGGCAMVFMGLLPALAGLQTRAGSGLGSARTTVNSAARQRLGKGLLMAQVAVATMLLAVGAVLLGTFLRVRAATPGVQPEHLEILQVQLKGQRYDSAVRTRGFVNAAASRLGAIPGVSSVAAVYGLPLDRGLNNSAGPADRPEMVRYAETRFVTPGYFSTLGTPLVAGQALGTGTEPVALINEFAAKRWFNSVNGALDRMVVDGGKPRSRVMGVVAPVHLSSLADTQAPTVYLPIAQIDDATAKMLNGWFPLSFALRMRPVGTGDPDIAHAAAAVISSLDPDIAVSKFVPMASFVERSYAAPQFFSWLAAGFAAFSLLLTAIGLFGLLSYQVASRTREIGVRMAVGASRGQIARLILQRGLLLTVVGLLVGVVMSFALDAPLLGFVANTLQVDMQDAQAVLTGRTVVLCVTAGAMLVTAASACWLPARRAAGVEPTEALRAE